MRQPRYQEIADALMSEIELGKFPVGTMLPTEIDLCERFGVSRFTVREALRRLHEKGILTRRRGSGTVVQNIEPESTYVRTTGTLEELLQFPQDMNSQYSDPVPIETPPELAKLLQCKPNKKWIHCGGVRSLVRQGTKICWTDVYIVPRYKGVFKDLSLNGRTICSHIVEKYGEQVQNLKVELTVCSMPDNLAKALDSDKGTPTLRIVRRYLGKDDNFFETTVSYYPENRYAYAIDFNRQS